MRASWRARGILLLGCAAAAITQVAFAEVGSMTVPKSVTAGEAFSIQSAGSGMATLYIIGPGQVLKRDVQLGETVYFSDGLLCNAGRYLAVLAQDSASEADAFDVVPAAKPATLSFLAKPSRLQVGLHDGITGAVYVFDLYRNLLVAPMQVSFELTNPAGAVQKHIVATNDGAAWTGMDSTQLEGIDKFVARLDDISSTRIVGQVPGDPCGLKMSVQPSGQKIQLTTEPVRDCNGNAVPDGTIVTFTETFGGIQSTVDVPLKRGIAEVQMPAINGSTITVASGVVLGNQIRWGK